MIGLPLLQTVFALVRVVPWNEVNAIHTPMPELPPEFADIPAADGACTVSVSVGENGKPYAASAWGCPEALADFTTQVVSGWTLATAKAGPFTTEIVVRWIQLEWWRDERRPANPLPVVATGPTVKNTVVPHFPERAAAAGIEATCQARSYIDERGRVFGVRILSCRELYASAVVSALSQWRYEPARNAAGEPVEGQFTNRINFKVSH